MCGVCGILDFRNEIAPGLVKAMCDCLAHRGPDDEGWYLDGPVALANRRLAVLDLTASGHQPMSSDGGRYHITYNGEVYRQV